MFLSSLAQFFSCDGLLWATSGLALVCPSFSDKLFSQYCDFAGDLSLRFAFLEFDLGDFVDLQSLDILFFLTFLESEVWWGVYWFSPVALLVEYFIEHGAGSVFSLGWAWR